MAGQNGKKGRTWGRKRERGGDSGEPILHQNIKISISEDQERKKGTTKTKETKNPTTAPRNGMTSRKGAARNNKKDTKPKSERTHRSPKKRRI